jgi:two-component system NarL family response regulator
MHSLSPERSRATSHSARIVVADDHRVLRLGLVTLINAQPDMRVVGEAATGEELVALYRARHPDLVLMDLRMPGPGGVRVIETITREDPTARIVVVTIQKGGDAMYQALRAGARGYVLKDVSSRDVLAAMRTVLAGGQAIPPAIAEALARRLSQDGLSPREVQVLRMIAGGLSNKEIGARLRIAEDTAKWNVTGLMAKLGVRDRTRAVTVALRRGIIDIEDVFALDEIAAPPTTPRSEPAAR